MMLELYLNLARGRKLILRLHALMWHRSISSAFSDGNILTPSWRATCSLCEVVGCLLHTAREMS